MNFGDNAFDQNSQENLTPAQRKEHNDIICNRFIARVDYDKTAFQILSIQDLCVLIDRAKWAISHYLYPGSEQLINREISMFYAALLEKLKTAKMLYTISDQHTGFPFIDENANNCVWLFSTHRYAEQAVDYYKQQNRDFTIWEIGAGQVLHLFEDCYDLGAYGAYVDNGLTGCMVKREDMLLAPDWTGKPVETIPVTNPGFILAHLKMRQESTWNVNYEGREEKLSRMEQELMRQTMQARFLVPMKKQDNPELPILTGADGSKAIAVYTDWKQFKRAYSEQEYGAWVMNFSDLSGEIMQGKADAFVINNKSCPMTVMKKDLEKMQQMTH